VQVFTLRGHGAPYGVYPAPVIPIGELNGSWVAVYPGGKDGPSIVPIDPDAPFVRYRPKTRASLSGFDFRSDRLFAYSPDDVRRYPVQQERQFLERFLTQSKYRAANAVIRRILQRHVDALKLAG
jgi:hypothetical protein